MTRLGRNAGQQAGLCGVCAAGLLVLQCGKDPELAAVALTKEVQAAFADQKWELGAKKAEEILALSGLSARTKEQAKERVQQAKAEQQARPYFQKFIGVKDTDADRAVTAYLALPADSSYRVLAKPDYDRIKPDYVADHLEKAEAALRNGRCTDFRGELALLAAVETGLAKVADLSKRTCVNKQL